jgi:hypothetical protein
MITVPKKRTLEEKLTQLSGASKPSMVPEPKAAKAAKVPEVVPDVRDVIKDTVSRLKLYKLAPRIYELGRLESEAKTAKKILVDQFKTILNSFTTEPIKFRVEELKASYYTMTRSTISVKKLLDHGISPKVIAECTETSESLSLRISAVGGKEEIDE